MTYVFYILYLAIHVHICACMHADMGGVVTLPVWGIALLVVLPFLTITGMIATAVSIKCVVIHRKKRRVAAIEK